MFVTVFLSLLAIVCAFIAHAIFIPSYRTYRMVNKIHGPKGLPIIGLGLTLKKLKYSDLLGYLKQQLNDYPRYATLWVVGIPIVLMEDPDDLAKLLVNTVNLKKGVEYDTFIPWLNDGLLVSSGEKWHSRRKLLTPTFHFKILEENLISMQKHAKVMRDKLIEKEGQKILLQEHIRRCALDIMCDTAMGVELGTQDNKSNDYMNCVIKLGEIVLYKVKNLHLHREWLFRLTPLGREFKKHLQELHGFTKKIIRERQAARINESAGIKQNNLVNGGNHTKKRKAFLDLLLELADDNKLSENDIREEVDTFLFEGHDTTSAALTFAIFLIGLHQDVQDKIVEELESVLHGSEDVLITMKDLNEMKYLEMVIKEVLRLYPSVPYISRLLTQDLQLNDGMVIPAGANCSIVPFLLHRNPKSFPDPEKFDPERFSVDNCANRHPFAYIPFSGGPKNCIGQKFAMMELKVVLATVLRLVRIESLTKPEDLLLSPMVILRSESPIYITVKPRNK